MFLHPNFWCRSISIKTLFRIILLVNKSVLQQLAVAPMLTHLQHQVTRLGVQTLNARTSTYTFGMRHPRLRPIEVIKILGRRVTYVGLESAST